tara:strand:- start:221 stop:616 length:396 start_codon:yes stop_codon:yes gene_type:complete
VTRLAEGKAALKNINPLTEERAVVRGTDLVSELVIYAIGGATVLIEYRRSETEKKVKEAKDAAKEQQYKEEAARNEQRQWTEFQNLERRITLLNEELASLKQEERQRRQLEAAAAAASDSSRHGWWPPWRR